MFVRSLIHKEFKRVNLNAHPLYYPRFDFSNSDFASICYQYLADPSSLMMALMMTANWWIGKLAILQAVRHSFFYKN